MSIIITNRFHYKAPTPSRLTPPHSWYTSGHITYVPYNISSVVQNILFLNPQLHTSAPLDFHHLLAQATHSCGHQGAVQDGFSCPWGSCRLSATLLVRTLATALPRHQAAPTLKH